MGGIQYVYWPGTTTRLTPWMLHCLQKLDADLRRNFGVHLVLDSSQGQRGIRTEQEQVDLFLSRYRLQASGNGPFGDVRYWKGRRYVRHSGPGTVKQPDGSNHEIQGTNAAIDVADSGGAGIGTMGSERSNWLRDNAENYGLEPEGFEFGEAWHYKIPNIFTPVPASAVGADVPKEDEMEAYVIAPNGAVVHLFSGGRHVFGSQQEYETYGQEVQFIRDRGGLEMAPVPALSNVVKVTWATFERLRKNFGVPDDGAFQGETIDVDKLAKDLAARMGYDITAVRAAVRAELASLTLKAG